MIIWLALFLLIVAVSFILAFRSMADFQEIPSQNEEYGLFLIRTTQGFTTSLLDSLHDELIKDNLIISFERLFKGQSTTLTIFGPRKMLISYRRQLDLLELEDYTKLDKGDLNAWEVGVKDPGFLKDLNLFDLFKNFPKLLDAEQFWWQLILKAKKGKEEPRLFISQIRAVVLAKDPQRRKSLSQTLQNLVSPKLLKIPQPYSTDQIIDFYQQRSLTREVHNPSLTGREIIKLTSFQ